MSGTQVWLASDDGLVWSHTDATVTSLENSQCSVTPTPITPTGCGLILVAQITFKSGFSGVKNVYMNASNKQGYNTGYVLKGTWTVP